MSIITLTSDFGLKDYAVASLKGTLLSLSNREITLVDISHEVEPFNLTEAAFLIHHVYHTFPKNTIHIIAVEAIVHPIHKPIVIQYDQHYFITCNHGLLSLAFSDHKIENRIEIDTAKDIRSITEDVFAKTAIQLAEGKSIQLLGKPIDKLKELMYIKPIFRENEIQGQVIYIDNYGNAITNITQQDFQQFGNNRTYKIEARNNTFTKIYQHYSECIENPEQENISHGKSLALFNNNRLEIAIFKSNRKTVGGASTLLGLVKGERIKITFS